MVFMWLFGFERCFMCIIVVFCIIIVNKFYDVVVGRVWVIVE